MIDGLRAALNGMRRYSNQFDSAAANIAKAGLETPSIDVNGDVAPPSPAATPNNTTGGSLIDDMVNLTIAHRMFTASIRVAHTADEMIDTAVHLGDRS